MAQKKTTQARRTKSGKASAKIRDMKPKKNPKGGLLLPAVQKVREAVVRRGP